MWVEHIFVEIDSYAIALSCSLVGQAWLLDGAYSWCEGVSSRKRGFCVSWLWSLRPVILSHGQQLDAIFYTLGFVGSPSASVMLCLG